MNSSTGLERFIGAQQASYHSALEEIRGGRKQTHWMWYIFPQIVGLGNSSMAQQYAIRSLDEAVAYMKHPVLGARLVEISRALVELPSNDPYSIFGSPDDMKLHSCMTLFSLVPDAPSIFNEVLQKFYHGKPDDKTLRILGRS